MSYYIGTMAEMPMGLHQEVEDFIKEHKDAVVLGTKQEEGIHMTLMGFLNDITLNTLYMQTNKESDKVKNIKAHNMVEIAITSHTGGIILTCSSQVVEDENLKKEKWEDWMIRYHPAGYTAPDYVLLHFVPQFIKLIVIEC